MGTDGKTTSYAHYAWGDISGLKEQDNFVGTAEWFEPRVGRIRVCDA